MNRNKQQEAETMTIQEMKARKKELGYSNAKVAELSGVPLGTVQKIFSGATASPRYETIRALEKVLAEDIEAAVHSFGGSVFADGSESSFGSDFTERSQAFSAGEADGASQLQESAVPYSAGSQGAYTLKDYYSLPEDQRFELIDGVIYDMTAPTTIHQIISAYLQYQFQKFINSKGRSCLAMISPLDVQLDCDERTMVQPDVIIVCDRSKITRRCVYGAPDFIAEVLSPSTRRTDMVIKLNKYLHAGVREYWAVDPDRKTVWVYDFEHEDFPHTAGFGEQLPVRIFGGECVIDLSDMYEQVRFIYEKEEPVQTENM